MAPLLSSSSPSAAAAGASNDTLPVINESDNFFAQLAVDHMYVGSHVMHLSPVSADTDHHMTFEMPKLEPPLCAFLGEAHLTLGLALVDKDGNPPAAYEQEVSGSGAVRVVPNIIPQNLYGNGIFRDVRLYLNDVLVSSSENGAYYLRSYLSTLLEYDSIWCSWMQGFSCYWDTENQFDFQGASSRTGQAARRKKFFINSDGQYHEKPVFVVSKIFTDFNDVTLPLIPGVKARLEFTTSDGSTYLMCNDDGAEQKGYRLKIRRARLSVPVRHMNAGLSLDLERRLEQSPVNYPLKRVEVKKIQLPQNVQSHTLDNLVLSSVSPDLMYIVIMPDKTFLGDLRTNSTELRPYIDGPGGERASLTGLDLTLNGNSLNAYEAGSHDELVLNGFFRFKQNDGAFDKHYRTADYGVDYEMYRGGYFVWSYDLTRSGRAYLSDAVRQPTKNGHLRLSVVFDQELPVSANLFCFNTYHSNVAIDKNRSVTYSFVA